MASAATVRLIARDFSPRVMPVTDALPPESLSIKWSAIPHTWIEMDHDFLTPEVPLIRTVLVVDDAGVVRRLSFRVLSEAGYRVFEAAGAVEALEVMAMLHGNVDLVLVDVVMPEVNGVDLVRLIREQWDRPSILFMSAYPAEVLAREGLKDLRVQFLAKPFTRDELLRAALRALEPDQRESQQNPTIRKHDP
jgi:CheY-like chemotaxis protein